MSKEKEMYNLIANDDPKKDNYSSNFNFNKGQRNKSKKDDTEFRNKVFSWLINGKNNENKTKQNKNMFLNTNKNNNNYLLNIEKNAETIINDFHHPKNIGPKKYLKLKHATKNLNNNKKFPSIFSK